jgi:hypothetical protein
MSVVLPAPFGPHQSEQFAFRHFQAEAFEGAMAVIGLANFRNFIHESWLVQRDDC